MRPASKTLGPGRFYSQEEAALAAGTDRHVAAYQEGQAAEHPLFRQPLLCLQQLPQTIGELYVEGHDRDCMRPGPRSGTALLAGGGYLWRGDGGMPAVSPLKLATYGPSGPNATRATASAGAVNGT